LWQSYKESVLSPCHTKRLYSVLRIWQRAVGGLCRLITFRCTTVRIINTIVALCFFQLWYFCKWIKSKTLYVLHGNVQGNTYHWWWVRYKSTFQWAIWLSVLVVIFRHTLNTIIMKSLFIYTEPNNKGTIKMITLFLKQNRS